MYAKTSPGVEPDTLSVCNIYTSAELFRTPVTVTRKRVLIMHADRGGREMGCIVESALSDLAPGLGILDLHARIM